MTGHVAIVGAGFSGTMLAVQLLRRGSGRVTLIGRAVEPGPGLAYGAADPIHLLNVRASNMSAFPDAPGDFVAWLHRHDPGVDGAGFAPRRVYGRYLKSLLADAAAAEPGRFSQIHGEAEDILLSEHGVEVRLAEGQAVHADQAVLALGNPAPNPPRGLALASIPPGIYWGDPWAPGVAEGLEDDDRVLIIGTGLTMIDMALMLDKAGFRGRTLALSRRGLLPRPHGAAGPPGERRTSAPTAAGSQLLAEVRERARAIGWREAVDELRPFTQSMWRATPAQQRSRFLRHLRPWWDVHRHRLAPELDARIQAMIAAGRLCVAAGKIGHFVPEGAAVTVSWRPRGDERSEHFSATRIINCTGPEGGLSKSADPLLRALAARATIRPGSCGIGLDVDEQARVLDASGKSDGRLHALGPLTRGAFWEISAVPDIRSQVQDVAHRLADCRQ